MHTCHLQKPDIGAAATNSPFVPQTVNPSQSKFAIAANVGCTSGVADPSKGGSERTLTNTINATVQFP